MGCDFLHSFTLAAGMNGSHMFLICYACLCPQLEEDEVPMPEAIQRLVEGKLVTENPELFLKNSFAKSEGLASLKKSTLNYLKYNRYHLTMYAQPGLL